MVVTLDELTKMEIQTNTGQWGTLDRVFYAGKN